MSCLSQTRPAVFLRIKTVKPTNAVKMLYSISSSKLHHTSGQCCIVTSNFLLFNNIIIMYCLSHNLLCSFTINSLHKKTTISSWVAPARQKCCHTANRLRVSKLTQLTIFHRTSPRVYRHGDSSRRCMPEKGGISAPGGGEPLTFITTSYCCSCLSKTLLVLCI